MSATVYLYRWEHPTGGPMNYQKEKLIQELQAIADREMLRNKAVSVVLFALIGQMCLGQEDEFSHKVADIIRDNIAKN